MGRFATGYRKYCNVPKFSTVMFVLGPLVLRALGGGLRRLLLGLVYLVETRLVLGSCNIHNFIFNHIHIQEKLTEKRWREISGNLYANKRHLEFVVFYLIVVTVFEHGTLHFSTASLFSSSQRKSS